MNIIEGALLWIIHSSLIATVMTVFIFIITKFFKNYISPRLQHALWLLVLIRLLLPVSLGSPLELLDFLSENYKSMFSYEQSDLNKSSLQTLERSKSNNMSQKDSIENTSNYFSNLDSSNDNDIYEKSSLKSLFFKLKMWVSEFKEKDSIEKVLKISCYIWIVGFTFITMLVLFATLRFNKSTSNFLKVTEPAVSSLLRLSKEKLGLDKRIFVYSSSDFKSPFIYGILDPKIYIPKNILYIANDKDLFHILLHELTHYKRKDLWCNFFSIIAISIHWFNPVVWFAMKKMREDRELACDNYLLETLEKDESVQYGITILHLSKTFINSSYKQNLSLYFYESKTQIERRIMMIKNFKKGSYKLSTVSVILLTLVGSATLAGAEGNIVNSNASLSVNQNIGKEDNEDFKLYSDKSRLSFNTLDRASDFVDFEFKVPDYFPQETKFRRITFNQEDGSIDMSFFKSYGIKDKDGYFNFLASKKDIITILKNNIKSRFKENSEAIVDYKEEPLSISNINGKNFTIKTNSTGKLKSSEEEIKSEYIEKYFVWNDGDMWYAIKYLQDYGDNFNFGISEDDMIKVIASLKDSKDVSKDKYTTKEFLNIYDKKDLIAAKEHLEFLPSFPLSISEDFIATSSGLQMLMESEEEMSNQNGKIFLETSYRQKSTLSLPVNSNTPRIYFTQQKDGSSYESLAKKMESGIYDEGDYINPLGPIESKRSKTSSLNINNVKVLTFNTVDYYAPDDIVEQTYYLWKQNDIYYDIMTMGKVDNHEAILKSFIK